MWFSPVANIHYLMLKAKIRVNLVMRLDNLNFALDSVIEVTPGVYLAFHHQLIHAANCTETTYH